MVDRLYSHTGTYSLRSDVNINGLCTAQQSISSTVGNVYYLRAVGRWNGDTPQTTDRSGSIGFINDASGPKFGATATVVSTTHVATGATLNIYISNRNIGGSKPAILEVDAVLLLNLTEYLGQETSQVNRIWILI